VNDERSQPVQARAPLAAAGSRRRLIGAIVISAIVASVVAGCGKSAEEKWAGSVCSDISDWKSQIQNAADDIQAQLQSPQLGMLAAIDADVQKALDATDELASELKSLEPPDTDEGAQAKQQLDALADQLQTTATSARTKVENVPQGAGAAETARRLVPLAPALQSLVVQTSSTLAAIQAEGKALKKGFEDADSCEPFRS
jgi:hypothetical protein